MMRTLDQVRDFSIERHGLQRYGNYPYVVHLDEVAFNTEYHGLGMVYKRAAYGHDLLDDTRTTLMEINQEFGEEEGRLIYAVSGPGINRAARRDEGCRRLTAYPPASNLKGIDRKVNMKACLRDGDSKRLKMYWGDRSFYAPIFLLCKPSVQDDLEDVYDQVRRYLGK